MKTKLFGSSGIRGVINVDFKPVLVATIGSAVSSFSKAEKILVGRDTRISGPIFEDALVAGLVSGGANVECLGVVPTPVLAYLTGVLKADAGIMITASHNPPQYNGLKIFDNDGLAYNTDKQNRIEMIVKDGSYKMADWKNLGRIISTDNRFLYSESIKKRIKLDKEWKVIVDPGCGAAYRVAPDLFKNLGCKVKTVNGQPDGLFPSRSPEPNRQSLKDLVRIVRGLDVDLGVAYDGDGDRVAFVDEEGSFVDFDQVLAGYAAYSTKKNHGGTVVTNVEASMCLEKMVEAEGGEVIRTRVGDVYVAEGVRQYHAVFGGEPCGAWMHPKFHYCPDGVYSSLTLLRALEDEELDLSEFISKTPKFQTLRENLPCKDETKYEVLKHLEEALMSSFPLYKDVSTVDGVRLSLQDGWILVRASGTEPLIRLTVEGESLKKAKEIMEKGSALVDEVIKETSR